MGIALANPWGLLALLAVPAIILIHFFQRQSRRIVVSTLFLLRQSDEDTQHGRRFKHLRQSLPLWLQILAALLLAWILAEPMFLRPDSAQRIVVALDSSLSMHAFRDKIEDQLHDLSRESRNNAARTEWILTETDPASATLYRGHNLAELLQQLNRWSPTLGTHATADTLRRALATAGDNGHAVYITDTTANKTPHGLAVRAIGEPIENTGFSGLLIENRDGQPIWRTIVRNFGAQQATRTWWIEARGDRTEPKPISLAPGAAMTLQGAFPPDTEAITLVLDDDPFPPDNRLPIVKPLRKKLAVALDGKHEQAATLLQSLPDITPAPSAETADCIVTFQTETPGALPAKAHIIFREKMDKDAKIRGGLIVAESTPLTESLNFNGLLVKGIPAFAPGEHARPLVWKNNRPLIFTDKRNGIENIIFDFSLEDSNADRLPAFILLLNRYTARLLGQKPGPESMNHETGSPMTLAGVTPAETISMRIRSAAHTGTRTLPAGTVRAPALPAFFEISRNGVPLHTGASHIADSRESDFHESATHADPLTFNTAGENNNYSGDPLAPLWLMLATGLMLWSWHATGRRD